MATAAAPPPKSDALRDRIAGLWPALRDAPLKLTLSALALIVLVIWQAYTAPPWELSAPAHDKSTVFLGADGTVIGRRGPPPREPVDASRLPPDVKNAFLAIEDRRFESHGGIDLRGLARATIANLKARSVVEGGSTITQQYVKNVLLSQDRTFSRKLKEMLLADWVENWLSKDEILSRYLAEIYFGEGQYGLAAAAKHYFDRTPDKLELGQAAMLAGLIKAPSRLAPTVDRPASLARMRLVLDAMTEAGFITEEEAAAEPDPRVTAAKPEPVDEPDGWLVDWLAQDLFEGFSGEVRTTLDPLLQARAERVIARAPLRDVEVALVAMRSDGRVVAMVGGRKWQPGAFNRATQAQRQPGSTFKLFDYFAAVRDGARPHDTVLDAPIEIGGWKPANAYPGYRGALTLVEAFGISSNTAAIRVAQTAGYGEVKRAARDLGVTSELPDGPSLPLGTASLNLTELTAAYAAFAEGRYPVKPHGLAQANVKPTHALDGEEWASMLALLWQSANEGTGRRAALSQPTFGKTGTSQAGRDALFVGFAGDLVAGVWIGRDDNRPVRGASGGQLPAEIWRAFMSGVDLRAVEQPYLAPEARPARPARVREAPGSGPIRKGGKGKRGKNKGKGKGKRR